MTLTQAQSDIGSQSADLTTATILIPTPLKTRRFHLSNG